MAGAKNCPSVAELREALEGQKSVAEVERLTRHLESCSRCLEVAEVALAADTLLAAAREATPTEEDPADRACIRKLIAQLKKLHAPRAEATAATRTAVAPPEAAGMPVPDEWDFLAPPRGGDELGWLGPYRVLKVLGAGGMGVVFLAEDDQLKRRVALKAMKPTLAASKSSRERFLREARTAASIEHDHIVPIYQVGEDRGVPYLAMQFLQGEALDDRLKREEPLPLGEILRITREAAEGLAAAHERGLIHRDIKPANLWLEGSRARVKLVDFGLARSVSDDAHLTQGGIVGTPAYMAPEQARGEKVDCRCDLFSLGCTLYRLATGKMPFHGRDTISTLLAVTNQEPRLPTEINPDLPPALVKLILHLLVKDPGQRVGSAHEVVKAIEAIERDLSKVPTAGLGKRPRATSKKVPGKTSKASEASPSPARLPAPAKKASTPPAATKSGGRLVWLLVAIGGLTLMSGLVILAAVLIRFGGSKGELVVEVDDPNVEVAVKQNNLVVVDRTKLRQFHLTPGDGELEVFDPDSGARFATKQFTITRDGKTTVQVRFRKPPAGPQPGPAEAALDPPAMEIVSVEKISDQAPYSAGTDLLRFREHWLCVFREAIGLAQGAGKIRVLASPDTKKWTSWTQIEVADTDLRDPHLSAMPDGRLMLVGGAAVPATRDPVKDHYSFISFSKDGKEWTPPRRVLDSWQWLWRATWHKGTAYGVAYGLNPMAKTSGVCTFYSSKDGLDWQKSAGLDSAGATESSLAFAGDTMYCLQRRSGNAMLGISSPPHQQWKWLDVGMPFESPQLILGPDGSWWAAGRIVEAGQKRTALCRLDVANGKLKVMTVLPSGGDNGYPGLAWDGKDLLMSYHSSHEGKTAIYLARFAPVRKRQAAADALRREDIPPAELAAAGEGDPQKAPAELVAVLGDSRLKHWGGAWRVAFSPDGKWVASSGGDAAVRVWDAATGRLVRVLRPATPAPHNSGMFTDRGLAFSPDGRWLIVTVHPVDVQLWEVDGWRARPKLKVLDEELRSLAFQPDGQVLAVGGKGGTIKLWNLETGKEKKALDTQAGGMGTLSFSPDGTLLASACQDKYVRVWDAATGQLRHKLEGHGKNVGFVAFTQNGKTLFSAANEEVRLWDPATGKLREKLLVDADVFQLTASGVVSLDAKTLVYGCTDRHIRVWDLAWNRLERTVPGHFHFVVGLAFSPDGVKLASAGYDGQVRITDVKTGRECIKIPGHAASLRCCCVSSDGRLALTAGLDDKPRLWDLATGQARHVLSSAGPPNMACAFSPDDRTAAYASYHQLCLSDTTTGQSKLMTEVGLVSMQALAFNPDGSALALGGGGKEPLILWDPAKSQRQRVFAGHDVTKMDTWSANVARVAFGPDGMHLVSGGYDGTVRLWDAATGKLLKTLAEWDGWVISVACSPDGKTVAAGGDHRNYVQLLDARTGQKLHVLPRSSGEAALGLAFSPDGQTLAVSDDMGKVCLWNVANGNLHRVITLVPRGNIFHVAFTPDGRYLLTANGNGTAYVLRLAPPPAKAGS